jgi:hypothetical protein
VRNCEASSSVIYSSFLLVLPSYAKISLGLCFQTSLTFVPNIPSIKKDQRGLILQGLFTSSTEDFLRQHVNLKTNRNVESLLYLGTGCVPGKYRVNLKRLKQKLNLHGKLRNFFLHTRAIFIHVKRVCYFIIRNMFLGGHAISARRHMRTSTARHRPPCCLVFLK